MNKYPRLRNDKDIEEYIKSWKDDEKRKGTNLDTEIMKSFIKKEDLKLKILKEQDPKEVAKLVRDHNAEQIKKVKQLEKALSDAWWRTMKRIVQENNPWEVMKKMPINPKELANDPTTKALIEQLETIETELQQVRSELETALKIDKEGGILLD